MVMNINEIFSRTKFTKREKKEQRQRELERFKNKVELSRMAGIFHDKQSKIRMVKKVEKNQIFQKDLRRMKEMLLKPNKTMMEKDYNVFKPNPNFLKSTSNQETTGFDKTFKKKKDFMLL